MLAPQVHLAEDCAECRLQYAEESTVDPKSFVQLVRPLRSQLTASLLAPAESGSAERIECEPSEDPLGQGGERALCCFVSSEVVDFDEKEMIASACFDGDGRVDWVALNYAEASVAARSSRLERRAARVSRLLEAAAGTLETDGNAHRKAYRAAARALMKTLRLPCLVTEIVSHEEDSEGVSERRTTRTIRRMSDLDLVLRFPLVADSYYRCEDHCCTRLGTSFGGDASGAAGRLCFTSGDDPEVDLIVINR